MNARCGEVQAPLVVSDGDAQSNTEEAPRPPGHHLEDVPALKAASRAFLAFISSMLSDILAISVCDVCQQCSAQLAMHTDRMHSPIATLHFNPVAIYPSRSYRRTNRSCNQVLMDGEMTASINASKHVHVANAVTNVAERDVLHISTTSCTP